MKRGLDRLWTRVSGLVEGQADGRAAVRAGQRRVKRRRSTRLVGESLEQRRLLAVDILNLPLPFSSQSPSGARGYQASQTFNLAAVGEIDEVLVPLTMGQSFSVRTVPSNSLLQTQVQLVDPANQVVATRTAAVAGHTVSLSDVPILADGTYRILVSSLAATGDVALRAFTSVTLESEANVGDNDFVSTAENLAGKSLAIATDGQRYLMSGSTRGDADWFRFPVTAGQSVSIEASTSSSTRIELTQIDGSILAIGEFGRIADYLASATGELAIRVSNPFSTRTDYTLAVSIDASLANSSARDFPNAQSIGPSGIAYGSLSDDVATLIRVAVHSDPFDGNEIQLINQLNDDTHFDFSAVKVTTDQIDSIDELLQYDVVVLGTPFEQLTPTAAVALRSFSEAGGGVVATGWFAFAYGSFSAVSAVGQPLNEILPVTIGSARRTSSTAVTPTAVAHPVTQGVSSFSFGGTNDYFSLIDNDAVVLARTNNNIDPAVVVSERGGRSVYLSPTYFLSTTQLASGDGDRLLEQAVAWAAIENTVDSFAFLGDPGLITVTATPRGGATPQPINDVRLAVDLYDLDSATPATPVATVTTDPLASAPPVLSYTNSSTSQRRYVATVRTTAGSGDYDVSITNGIVLPPVGQLTVESSTVPSGQVLNFFDSQVTVVFDRPLLFSSVQASDLMVGAMTATSVMAIDSRTVSFDISNVDVGDGLYAVTLNNISALDGTAMLPLNASFTIDRVAPQVTNTTFDTVINGQSADVTFELTVNEPLDPNSIDSFPFRVIASDLPNGSQNAFNANNANYDPVTNQISVSFTGLPQSRYTFIVDTSFSNVLTDLAGNVIDAAGTGESFSVLQVPFDVDFDPAVPASVALSPLGAGVSQIQVESVAGIVGDADSFVVEIESGAQIAILADPAFSADRLQIDFLNAVGVVVATASSPATGGTARLSSQVIADAGIYTVRITSLTALGRYNVRVLFGAGLEQESGEGGNDTLATAEIPAMTPRVLAGTATTTAIAGVIGNRTAVSEIDEIGFSEDFTDTPQGITRSGVVGGEFLLTNGFDLYSLASDGTLAFQTSLPTFAQAIVMDGQNLLTGSFNAELQVVNPADGSLISTITLTRDGGGSVFGIYALVRTSDNSLFALFEGSGLDTRALGRIDLATGTLTTIADLGSFYSSIAFDAQDRLLAWLPSQTQNDGPSLFEIDYADGLRTSLVHDFGSLQPTQSVIGFSNSGELYRATNPFFLSGGGGGGGELSTALGAANSQTGDWQRLALTTTQDNTDVHAVTLAAGQWLSLATNRTDVRLELLNPAGQVVALGSARGSVSAIEGFTAPTAGTYHVRLTSFAPAADYRLIISRDANLALVGSSAAQPVPPTGVVYGRTGAGLIGETVAINQPTTFGRTVFDSLNFRWDIQPDGSISDGSSDAYDGGMVLNGFSGSFNGFQDASGRSFRVGPSTVAGLSTRRSIYVPTDDTFARFIDSFTNNSSSSITTSISYSTNLGSDGSELVLATSSGDTAVGVNDRWILTDDFSNGAGDPAVGHLFAGNGAVQPIAVSHPSGNVLWSYSLTVAPGETVSLMSFAVQNFNRAAAEATVRLVADLAPGTLRSLPEDVAGTIANWSVSAGTAFELTAANPTSLRIATATPGDAAGLPLNAADPRLTLFYRDGSSPSTAIAVDDNSGADGRNALLVHPILAGALGRYGFNVAGSPGGDYVAIVSATNPEDIVEANSLSAEFIDIDAGANLVIFPDRVRVTFDADLNLVSVSPADLRINGLPAAAVEFIDGRTLEFDIADANVGDGAYSLSISVGAISSLRGAPVAAITRSFTVDAISPTVIASTVATGATVSPGQLIYQVTFSELLDTVGLGPEDFTLTAAGGIAVIANSMIYDPVASIATVTFEGLVETTYTLRIISAPTAVRDLIGNLLDGGPSFPLPSGDGVPGDDFVVAFTVDAGTTTLPTPSVSLQPAASRIYKSESAALIGQSGDSDRFVIELKAGQPFFVTATGVSTLAPRVRVFDPNAVELAVADGVAGGVAQVPLLVAPVDGSYAVVVESADTTVGAYSVAVLLGAAPENETFTGASNDTLATAQDLSFLVVQPDEAVVGAATGAAVVGQGGSLDHYRFNVTAGRPVSIAAALAPSATGLPAGGLSLLAADGTVLAVGSARADGFVQDIAEFVPSVDGVLFVRIDALTGSTYQLVIADGAAIDVEPNDDSASAQRIQVSTTILGAIAVGGSSYTVDFSDSVGGLSFDQFTPTGLWHVTDVCDSSPTGHSAPNFAYFGIDSSCNFNAGTVSGTLTSPPLGLRAGTSPSLRLKYRLGSESGTTYDRAEVQVSTDNGLTFTRVADKNTHFAQASTWTATEIDLSAYAGQSVLLRFSFASIDGVANTGLGWQIDDLEVTGVADLEDRYAIPANAGDTLNIRALPVISLGAQPAGTLSPQLELIDSAGLVVAAGTTSMSYTIPVGGGGLYRARVSGSGAGDYRIELSGSSVDGDTIAALVASVPADSQSLATAPSRVQLTFDQGIRIDSLQAADLEFANAAITTTGIEVIDGNTIAFVVNVPAGIDGNLAYSVAAGALLDLQGTALNAINGSFTIDRVGPVVLDTTPSTQASAPFSTILFVFNEPLDRNSVDVNDIVTFTSPSGANLRPQISGVVVDGATVRVNFTAQTLVGNYTFTIGGNITDAVGNLIDQDGNGTGGEATDVFTRVISLQSPDLSPVVNGFIGTTTFGQTLAVNYTVRNIGNDPALERWRDRIYLSTNTTLDRDDRLLVTSPSTNTLGPLDAFGGANDSYTRSVNVTLPLTVDLSSGTYYLLVETDAGFTQPETNEANNVAATSALAINLPPLPDLVIEAVVVPSSALSGQQIPIQWQLANRGTGDFTGTITDAIRLSTDTVVGNDAFLANFNFTGTIAAGGSVLRQQLVTLPLATEGQRYLVFTTDAGGGVFEHLGENNNSTLSSVIDVTLAPLPNLRVTSVTPPVSAFSSQSTIVNFVVTNTGSGPTTAAVWYDAVYLSSDGVLDSSDVYLGAQVNPGFLEPAGSYASSLQVTLPRGIAGDYQLIVVTDSDNRVFENQFENDNVTVSAVFPVTLTPPPDLQVQSVTGPFSAFSGGPANVSWTVVNNGTGRTLETAWFDDVYLSTNTTLDGSDLRLGTVLHTGFINAGATYSVVNRPFNLPVGISGDYFFIVVTDSQNNVYENVFEQNNVGNSAASTDVRLTPPPDLVPTFTTLPATLSAGREFNVAFTVTNNGISPTVENNWSDRLFLSTDAVLDATDLLVQSKTHYGNVGVFQSYSETLTSSLPWSVSAGNYFLILATDFTDAVFELENANNIVSSATAIPVTVAAPDLVPQTLAAPTALTAGQIISATWTVQNSGIGSTNVSRRDDLVLSTDNILGNSDDRVLKSVTVNTVVLAGDTQSVVADNVTVPLELATGIYNLFVRVDATGLQFESSEANNFFGPSIVNVTQTLPDLVAENITFSPLQLSSQSQLTIDWTSRNQGAAATNTGYWVDRIYLSSDNQLSPNDLFAGSLSQNTVLAAGASRARQAVIGLPTEISGDFFVIIESDSNGQVIEGAGESNNVAASASTVNVTLVPTPDLRVTAVDAPVTAFSGQPINLTWTVTNSATVPAIGNWYDAVYLSADQVFDRATDTYIGFRNRPSELTVGGLAAGAVYNQTASFEIPLGIAGPLYVFVATDSGNQIFERGAELNNSGYDPSPVNATLLPPADLVVGTITVPPSSDVGATVTIAYTVRNQGVNPARGQWQDSLFLSADGSFSIDDLPLGTVSHNGDVAGLGGEYSEVLNARLPGVIPGNYQIIVRSDIRNAIAESNEANNISGSLDAFAINLPQLTLGVAATGQLAANESLFWTIQLTAGDSVRFRLDNASADSTSELFIRRGSIPSRAQFDFAANVPFTNDPAVVIPVEETGTYFVLAYGAIAAANNAFNLLAENVPLSVFDVQTNRIGDAGPATVKISGARFSTDTQFALVSPTDPTLVLGASDVLIQDSVTAFVTFNANDFPQGTYNVVAQNDGLIATLDASVTVVNTIEGDVLVTIDGAARVRPDRFNPFRVQYTNDGNTDFSAPLFIVQNPDNLQVGFTTADARTLPLHLFGVAPDGDSGVLRPGTIGSIPLVFNSNATGDVNLPVVPIRANDVRIVTDAQWIQIAASIRPQDLTNIQWDPFWARIQPRIGPTWGHYVRFVQDLHQRTKDLDIRKGDVRSMMRAVFDDDSNWRPSNIVSGRLLDSGTAAAPIADIPIAAYRVTGGANELEGTTVTAADGSFTFVALTPGDYVFGIDYDNHFFDANRDGVIDNDSPRLDVSTADVNDLVLYVAASPEPVVTESQPAVIVDASGTSHIVWLANQQLWHAVGDASGQWTQAQAIPAAVGSDPVLISGDQLANGGPGLMAIYRTGNADDAELFYVLGRLNDARTAYIWSDPVAMTDDAVHDGGFDAAVASNGLPVVLSQRLRIGDDANDTNDDADIYSWSEAPTGDFETALLAALERALAEVENNSDVDVEGGSVRFRLQNIGFGPRTIPNWVPYLGGKYEANFRASATVSANDCKASGRITAEGQVKFTDYVEGNLRGEGGVEFSSQGTRGACEYEFDNAFLSGGGGAAGDIPFAKIPGLGKIEANAGVRLEGQAGLNFRWEQGSSFPSWPSKVDGSLRVGIGGFAKGKSSFSWLGGADLVLRVIGSASWRINSPSDWDFRGFSVAVLARAEIKVKNPITGTEYKTFKEFTFTWNSSGESGSNSLALLGGPIDTTQVRELEEATNPDNITFGIETITSGGNLIDYGTSSFSAIAQDLQEDTRPTLSTGPDGTVYGLWSNSGGVRVHQYNPTTDSWSLLGTVGDDAGLATRDAKLTFDASGQGIIVFAGQDYSGLSDTSTPAQIETVFDQGAELYYATFNPTTSQFSADMPLFSLAGDDSGVSLLSVAGGDTIAVWTHTDNDSAANVYSSRWNAATATWSAATVIASAVTIGSRPAVSIVGGIPTIIWSQTDTAMIDDQFDTSSPSQLMTSRFVNGAWTAPADFTFGTLVTTTRIAATASGEQVQIFTSPNGELSVITRNTLAGGWSLPTRLSVGGNVQLDTAAVAFDNAGQAVAVWIEVVRDDAGIAISSAVNYAAFNAANGTWSEPLRLAIGGASIGQLRLIENLDGGLVVAWTEGNSSGDQSLRTANWSPSTASFNTASTRSNQVLAGSVSVGRVAGDTVLVWRQSGGETSLAQGLTYSILGQGGWGEAISAESMVNAEVTQRSAEVTREASRTQAFDQYQIGIAQLLTQYLGGASVLMTGAGIYLHAAGILPFSPPEDCCKCDKFDERTVGSDEGCGSSTEVDQENCIRITTYKPCVERPRDPNDIIGPEGFGEERWVSSLELLSYRIRFENAADANAAAQLVDVTQPLDDDLSLPTFKIIGFGFRGYNFTVPNSPPFYTTVIDLTAELGVLVEFTAGIDVATREAFWRLVALDPATGQPPLNPDLGLLIPNDADGNGEGYLDYTITAKSNVVTGTRIDAQARIVFDTEEPIDTPPIFNTLDAAAPTSNVIPGTAPEQAEFTVMWAGSDESDGSGLASYTILVSTNGGDYSVWLDETTATEAVYTGTPGSTYAFVSLAADNTDNLEALPDTPDWTVTLPGGVAAIGDFVWNDLNNNGIRDLGEPGVDGVTVTLFSDNGTPAGTQVATAITAAGGAYVFANLPTDVSYFMTITAPAGFAIGKPLQGTDTAIDSDFALDGRTAVFTVNNGDNLTVDAALVQTGSIAGTIWEDLDGDSLRDAGEPNLVGWTVYLDLNDNGSLDANEPSRVSDSQGQYSFTDLRPDTYVVAEVIQAGYIQTFPGPAGANSTDRSFVRSGSQAELYLQSIDGELDDPASGQLPAELSTDPNAGGSAASRWIGLDRFLSDSRFTNASAGTVVVIDTGIDIDHPFFGPDANGDGIADRIVFQYDFADNDFDASDQTGHGSHVASLIAGSDLTYPGVAPGANIIALKVFKDSGRGTFADVERALAWVIENANAYSIDAVNLSIGDGLNWSDTIGGYGISDELAVLAEIGVVAVAAAGNGYGLFNNEGLAYPGADPNTISVGAVWDSNRGGPWRFGANGTDFSTAAGRIASFSQRDRDTLDVLAPGAVLTGANQYGGVSALRGTSMSAPQVTGAAIWAQSLARATLGRSLSTSEFRYLVRQSGTRLVDGDDENDNVFNTGASFAGLNLVSLGEAILAYDGSFDGTGFGFVDDDGGDGNNGPAAGRPNRYVIDLAPGQNRVVVDFGNQLADSEAPQVVDFSAVSPTVRNIGIGEIEVTFSEALDPASFTVDDFTLLRNGTPVLLAGATLAEVNATTWRLSGLGSLTSGEGAYSLTLLGSAFSDLAGNVGQGTASTAFTVDTTAAVGVVQSFGSHQSSASFTITVGGQDPISGGVSSGVDVYEIYRQINGGAFSLWTTVPAATPSAQYTAQSNQTLGFYAIAIDVAGNRETGVPVREVATLVGDVDLPVTAVTNVISTTPALVVQFTGSDPGGSGLVAFELFVSVDGTAPRPAGTLSRPATNGTVTGSLTVPALEDGVSHSYRFFTVGVDSAGNREAVPGSNDDVTVMVAFDAPTLAEITNFRIQNGSVARSYIRNLAVDLSQTTLAAGIAASLTDADPMNDRLSLVRFNSNRSDPGTAVPVTNLVTANGATLDFDFGPQGIGGNRNSMNGDGYYELHVDVDGIAANGNESLLTFYRLLGDTNGDRSVNIVDVQNVDGAVGQSGINSADVNGDLAVNVIDRALVRRGMGLGTPIDPLLPLTDPATLGLPRVTNFDVQNGQTQRSFVNRIDTELSQAQLVDAIVATLANGTAADDRLKLERFDLNGLGLPQSVDLAGRVSAVDRVLAINFGSGGISGTGSSNAGDGYYQLAVDLDGNIGNGYEARLRFYRLLGDVNGDHVVDQFDTAAVNTGNNPEADANGDGVINVVDRFLVSRAQGRQLNNTLELND